MNFGNNIEAMAFDKSGWHLIEQRDDGAGNVTIYMGKSMTPEPMPEDKVWLIKKTTVMQGKGGYQIIETKYSQPRQSWLEKESVEYKYFWS